MKRTLVVAVSAISLFATASCGGDSGTPNISTKGDFAEALVKSVRESGMEIDEDCVNSAAEEIPDADFALIQENIEGILDDSVNPSDLALSDDAIVAFVTIATCYQLGS